MAPTLEEQVSAAQAAGRRGDAWELYKQSWLNGHRAEMSGDVFAWLFFDGEYASAAVALARIDATARDALRQAALRVPFHMLDDHDRQRVVAEVLDVDDLLNHWQTGRTSMPPGLRVRLARARVQCALDTAGRAVVRDYLRANWVALGLMEEEVEAVIEALANAGALTLRLLRELGSEAEHCAYRLLARGHIPDYWTSDGPSPPQVFAESSAPAAVQVRAAALLQDVCVRADLRDAGLTADEYARLAHPWLAPAHSYRVRAAARHLPSELWDLLRPPMRQTEPVSGPVVQFPLLRLLHMRMILETPILRPTEAGADPSLVLPVMLHMLSSEGVTYYPELRVPRESGQRWRAVWAERTGETIAVLMLEDAIGLDLSTLVRIPAGNKEPTPDFMAAAERGEHIVLECKGSTDWKTHCSQKQKALQQLCKGPAPEGTPLVALSAGGRGFACCLYAALQRSERESLVHVEDPLFAFEALFHEGWETAARRRHYAAVLEACDQFDAADRLLGRRPLSGTEREQRSSAFALGDEDDSGLRFRGVWDRVDDTGRRLGYDDFERFTGIRVFRGISEGRYQALMSGDYGSDQMEEERQPAGRLPRVGTLPPRKGGHQGVYSLLSDGAFLALVLP
jgi:hypothetical protein